MVSPNGGAGDCSAGEWGAGGGEGTRGNGGEPSPALQAKPTPCSECASLRGGAAPCSRRRPLRALTRQRAKSRGRDAQRQELALGVVLVRVSAAEMRCRGSALTTTGRTTKA